ncbi:MAG: hypothetical protein Q9225_003483 [Loekoesia sp. 1 TL-2023]
MLQTIPEDIQKEIISSNSTRCWRDLSIAELDYINAANKGTELSMKKAGPRRLAEKARLVKEQEKRRRSMGKKGDEVRVYPVVPEALEKRTTPVPKPKHGYRYHPTTKVPSVNAQSFESTGKKLGGHNSSESVVELSGQRNSKRTASPSPVGAQIKRPKISTTTNADQNSGIKEYSGHTTPNLAGPDFRYKKPSTALEIISIQEALNISRDDYERYTGYPPVIRTDRTESYGFQLSELQVSLSKQHNLGDSAPVLKQFGKWSGSIDSWRALGAPRGKRNEGTTQNDQDFEGDTLVDMDN